MADEKKDLFGKEKLVLQAKEGFSLPVRYEGAWVRVSKDKPVEFVVAKLPYEAKIEIKAALAAKQIFETVMPAPVPEKKAKPASDQPAKEK